MLHWSGWNLTSKICIHLKILVLARNLSSAEDVSWQKNGLYCVCDNRKTVRPCNLKHFGVTLWLECCMSLVSTLPDGTVIFALSHKVLGAGGVPVFWCLLYCLQNSSVSEVSAKYGYYKWIINNSKIMQHNVTILLPSWVFIPPVHIALWGKVINWMNFQFISTCAWLVRIVNCFIVLVGK